MKLFTVQRIARAGIISALYVLLSVMVFPIASGAIQVRISEGLCLLPLLYVEAVPALFVGCMLGNLLTGCTLFDILLGSCITLVSAILTYLTGRIIKSRVLSIVVGGLFPVLLNAFLLPLIWLYLSGGIEYLYWVQLLVLLAGQTVSVYAVGTPAVLGAENLMNRGIKGFIK